MTPDELPADMEVVAWMDRDVAWDVISDFHKKRWSEINGPEGTQRYSRPLYASPVVPVGVSREDIARLLHAIVDSDGTLVRVEEAVDAILAALRPTDTGREA